MTPASATDDNAELIAIDKAMPRAFVDRDLATLERVLTEDYVMLHPVRTYWKPAR